MQILFYNRYIFLQMTKSYGHVGKLFFFIFFFLHLLLLDLQGMLPLLNFYRYMYIY